MTTPPQAEHTCKLVLDGEERELPVIVGTEDEKAIDISTLRADTGYITSDSGYGNTGSCKSAITFIDGEKGILRYRGIPIEQLAEKSTFRETAFLIIYGRLPSRDEITEFSDRLTEHELIHDDFNHHFDGFPQGSHPMAILSAMVNTLGCFHPSLITLDENYDFDKAAAMLLSKVRTITAFTYKKSVGQPIVYPNPDLSYCSNLLHMMFSIPYKEYVPHPAVVRALSLILILHADHEQNCSTSTVRMVGSSKANLFASVSAGISALWGPLHGGANMAVIKMLEELTASNLTIEDILAKVKDKEIKLMGFGHRVYKNFDPRAKIIKKACDELFEALGINEPILDLAKELEEAALSDDYFVERKLYPNVDFYSGIMMKAMGIPVNMFTVMFAIGRMPGWIANWKEMSETPGGRIYRPRQIYVGPTENDYVPIDQR